jgi:hypothetical protein
MFSFSLEKLGLLPYLEHLPINIMIIGRPIDNDASQLICFSSSIYCLQAYLDFIFWGGETKAQIILFRPFVD